MREKCRRYTERLGHLKRICLYTMFVTVISDVKQKSIVPQNRFHKGATIIESPFNNLSEFM
jgi:hypothetical protein